MTLHVLKDFSCLIRFRPRTVQHIQTPEYNTHFSGILKDTSPAQWPQCLSADTPGPPPHMGGPECNFVNISTCFIFALTAKITIFYINRTHPADKIILIIICCQNFYKMTGGKKLFDLSWWLISLQDILTYFCSDILSAVWFEG